MTQNQNLGDWLNDRYQDRATFESAIRRIAYERRPDHMPALVSIVPNSTVNELFVGLHQLDYSKDAKSGCV